ncbi:class D beta-lactamase [Hoeflea poritis]|uniref:Beta-lactamase n=1 Tax=Hoeflea poritis TaxID=2993659 RepID=A0ABT4VHJ9_9HYPH|nr:class D beta-lactamase [Hoeflea poritis]MDA4844150.1 class D beta-lactamase [Hoeflea poritis]
MNRMYFFLLFLLAIVPPAFGDDAYPVVDHPDLEALFAEQNVAGAFVLLDPVTGAVHAVNPSRIEERRIPASTFKIANSLIALETGAVRDEDEVIPYGGEPQPIKAWERDMDMREAIRVSNVPVFQELANRIGGEAYAEWLKRFDYGNRATADNAKAFWLRGPLAISPQEQIAFVARLAAGTLPASQENQDTVRDMLLIERRGPASLYGKSGWSVSAEPQIGWWVGWVEKDGAAFVFALTIDMEGRKDADKREILMRALLKELGVYG